MDEEVRTITYDFMKNISLKIVRVAEILHGKVVKGTGTLQVSWARCVARQLRALVGWRHRDRHVTGNNTRLATFRYMALVARIQFLSPTRKRTTIWFVCKSGVKLSKQGQAIHEPNKQTKGVERTRYQ